MDPHSAHLATLWHSHVSSVGGQFDAVFEDESDRVLNATAVPCKWTESDWTTASNQMATNATLGHGVIYNELAELTKNGKVISVSPIIALNQTSIGGMMEGCYLAPGNTSSSKVDGAVWAAYENTEIAMAQQHKLFFCVAGSSSDAASSVDWRTYYTASYLMPYDFGPTILGEKFATPSRFHEEPESELVATNPLVSTPSDVSSLMISPNVYGREYAACYIAGVSVGACAVAVNADAPGYTHPFPWASKYQHTLVLSGGGILDGGTISAHGPAPPKKIAGNDAVVAFR
ncbi:MAG: hypothetical protein GIW99_06495 [Candidatus Eremiobacteraeota bacterium]|nr:hypothetical protein [Candidatus Eremiobacteraeota bacterium]